MNEDIVSSETETPLETSIVNYELMLIFFPDLGEAGIKKEFGEISEHLSSNSGKIFHEDVWGNRDLAYKIKKQTQGYYIVINFSYPPEKVAELEKGLNINPAVVRYLIIKTPLNYSIKTLQEYQVEDEQMAQEKEKAMGSAPEKKDRGAGRFESTRKPDAGKTRASEPKPLLKAKEEPVAPKEEPKVKKVAKVEKPVEEAEEKPKKAKKAVESSSKLDDFDQKLKNIIDDPDITL